MKRYLVVRVVRSDMQGRAVIPFLFVGLALSPSPDLVAVAIAESDTMLAIVEVSHNTEIEIMDLQSFLLKLYGNSNYKQPV